jgi:hypothetical protein
MSVNILDGYNVAVSNPPAFTGGTNGTRGDKDAAGGTAHPLFVTRGDVKVIVYGVCTTTLVGAGTIEVGVAGNTALILAQVADATTIAAGDVYVDASVAEVGGFVATALPAATFLVGSQTIVEKVGTADVTAGAMYYVCLWIPITPGATVEAYGSQVAFKA